MRCHSVGFGTASRMPVGHHVVSFATRFRRFRGDEFLKARIIPQRIKHGIEPEQCRSKRHVCRKRACVRYREQSLQSVYSTVGFAHFRGYARKDIERNGTI
jgi:hypothetical protein